MFHNRKTDWLRFSFIDCVGYCGCCWIYEIKMKETEEQVKELEELLNESEFKPIENRFWNWLKALKN